MQINIKDEQNNIVYTYGESLWTGKRTLFVNGVEAKKITKKKPIFLVGLNNYIDICVINYVKSEKVFLHHLMYYKKIAKNYLTEI